MNQDNGHIGAAGAGDTAAAHARTTSLGVCIGVGARLGLVAGLLFGDMPLGMLYGAGVGTVVDAVRELVQPRPTSAQKPTRVRGPARPASHK